jgi:hypothetical protein
MAAIRRSGCRVPADELWREEDPGRRSASSLCLSLGRGENGPFPDGVVAPGYLNTHIVQRWA